MSDFNSGIIREFRANGGKGEFDGVSLLILHHIGAKSHTARMNPVVCYPQPDGRIAIIASNGGAQTNPDWYHNVKAHPEVEVEFDTEVFTAVANELRGTERDAVWADALRSAPQLEGLQKKTTSRQIPVLLLTRRS